MSRRSQRAIAFAASVLAAAGLMGSTPRTAVAQAAKDASPNGRVSSQPPASASQPRPGPAPTAKDPAPAKAPGDGPAPVSTREPAFAEFVPPSASVFVSVRNLRAVDHALRRAHAWPLLASWSQDDDMERMPEIRTALEALLGPRNTINLNEFMEAEIAVVAADAPELSHLVWLVRARDPAVIDRWFPPDRRLAKHEYPAAHAFRMDTGLVVTVRGNVFAMGRRWSGDQVLVDTMRLLQGADGASLARDPEYRTLAATLPGTLLATASVVLGSDEGRREGADRTGTDLFSSLWPMHGRVVFGLAEGRGGLDLVVRGNGGFPAERGAVSPAVVTQLLSLPSTTILATATTISGPLGSPFASFAAPPSAVSRYVRMFDAMHRSGPRGGTPLPPIGPGLIVAWDQDLEGSGAAPQAAVMVQCPDAARLADDLRSALADFARLFPPPTSPPGETPLLELDWSTHLGVSYSSLSLASLVRGTSNPILGLLRGAEISWTAVDDWLILALSREQLERILDARAGLVLPLRGLKDAPRLGSHPTDYRFVTLLQPSSAAEVLERWRGKIADADRARQGAAESGGSASRGVPDHGIGLAFAAERSGGGAVVEGIDEAGPLRDRLLRGDVILGVDGQLLALATPVADLRDKLSVGGGPAGKVLRVQRAGTMLEVTVPPSAPSAPEPVEPTTVPPLEALEDLVSAARSISVATFALEGGEPTRYSARLSLRFVPLTRDGKQAAGK